MSEHVCGPCKKGLPTFPVARKALLEYLAREGYTLSGNLKVPHATSRNGNVRFWFKPQAVYVTVGTAHSMNGARSTHDDIRLYPPEQWLRRVTAWLETIGML